jgi:hypothetical protein
MSTPSRPRQPPGPTNLPGIAHRERGLRRLRTATILTVAGAALVTMIGTSLASQPATHHTSGGSGGVASSAAAIAAAQQASSNQASASSGNASASAATPSSSQSTPAASSGGS